MWRVVSVLIVSFWAVMTVLLVRVTWFPEGSQLAEVPPRVVLQQFLEQGSAMASANTFHVYHGDRKIGHATVSCSRLRGDGEHGLRDFALRLDGRLDEGAIAKLEDIVTFGLELRLRDVLRFAGSKGNVRFEKGRLVASFAWPEGAPKPTLLVKQRGQVMMDDRLWQMMSGEALAGTEAGAFAAQLGVSPSAEVSSLVRLSARESLRTFAGHKSKGHALELTAMEHWKARAFFTAGGELVLVDLPGGYRLVEPVIHGLGPNYDEEEMEVQASANGKS
ncbi:MAG: hypothetical protein ACOYMN_15785 [Roseimicrobium sp.]